MNAVERWVFSFGLDVNRWQAESFLKSSIHASHGNGCSIGSADKMPTKTVH